MLFLRKSKFEVYKQKGIYISRLNSASCNNSFLHINLLHRIYSHSKEEVSFLVLFPY